MLVSRVPCGPLRPFVQRLWVSNEAEGGAGAMVEGGEARELVVPTGAMHVVVRLRDPLRVFDGVDDPRGRTVGRAVVGGARASFYVRDVSRPSCSVGAMLHPGASLPLLGVPAEALAERHTALEELWGGEVERIRERLLALRSPDERLDAFEAVLARRLPRVMGMHPAVAHALQRFDAASAAASAAAAASVGTVVRETGYSHRRFLTLFREAVGLSPKRYCRVLRVRSVLGAIEGAGAGKLRWTQVALEAGFSDQAHLTREFREMVGVTPAELARIAPRHRHHVPVSGRGQIPSRRAPPGDPSSGS